MRSSFTRIIIASSALYAIACSLFIFLLMQYEASRTVIALSVLFVLAAAGIFTGFMLGIRNQMSSILSKLSLTIQSIIDRQDSELFPVSEDNLLSKLQEQVLKLSGILRMQKQRYKEESEEVKSLISDIAHQLKTPLANLTIYNGLLMDSGLTADKRQEFTRILLSQTEKLTWLMDNLIKMSRLESGIIKIQTEKHDIGQTVFAAIKQMYPHAEKKNVEIQFSGEQSIELQHDVKWTGEALVNVLDNAVKYTDEAGVIKVSIHKYEMFARIDIEDNGKGIPEHEVSQIFKRFYRGADAVDTHGVGIGLYLARKIITEQGGYIKVSSEWGKGSMFSIFIPVCDS
ncbi:sensor histidine kinase KdpD [Paenibacillus sp. PAMC21692]|uniref:sensor histidine kinase n=1 Tax=Paenibacillus sp. PAMC21692 TaxID=2762320 RepID=UPI00164E92D8|nr:HAMP domain-containing sensor histidine kinase [Paenibacillus sp. PAMC21692]QNK56511.1 HAMP domain-containing histidine kinase [Paenibacillus sp. PAMC21692]